MTDPRWAFLDDAQPRLLAAFGADGVTSVRYVAAFPHLDGVAVWLCTTTDAERDALGLTAPRLNDVRRILLDVGLGEEELSGSGLVTTKQSQETVDREFEGNWLYAMR